MVREYTAEEMEAIVRRALERQGTDEGFTHDDLMAAAAQIGLPPDEVEAAAAEVAFERDRMRWEENAKSRRRHRLLGRLGTAVGLNGVLFAIDALTGGGWWVQWVVLGTGIPLSVQALRLYRPVEEREVDRERKREEREQRRRARALRRRRRPRSPTEDFEVVVERGVDLLLDALDHRRQKEPPVGSPGQRAPAATAPRVRVGGQDPDRQDADDESEPGRSRARSGDRD